MSKINPQRFTAEEFPEQQGWIEKLFAPLNQFTGDVVRSYSNQLTIADNLFQEIREIKFQNTASNFPIKVKTKLTYIYILNNTTGSYSVLAPHIVWTWADSQLNISNISGLTASITYTIRVLLFYE
jgi:hypothetical protein